MFSQARKLRELQKSRECGALSTLEYTEQKARVIVQERRRHYFEPEKGFLLTEVSVENGRKVVQFALRAGIAVAVALIILLMLSR